MFVSNTSTLVLLAKISLLQKFVDNSPKIIIPDKVRKEYLEYKTFDTDLIEKEVERKNIIVKKVDKKKLTTILEQFNLDIGEAEAYALFDHKKHKAILTDDKELIKLCRIERIPFICAMAIVVRLNEKKIITKNEALIKLEKLLSIGMYSKNIYEHYKKEVK